MMTRARTTLAGVRAVAIFEAAKGLLVLAVGLGLLTLLHHDLQRAAESLVRHLHLDPARHYPRIFLKAASRLNDRRLTLLAVGAFAYAVLRFVEAYGLWYVRHWAEWVAIISTGLYLPVELFELVQRATAVRAFVFISNLLIVAGMLYVRFWVPEEELRQAEPGARRRVESRG